MYMHANFVAEMPKEAFLSSEFVLCLLLLLLMHEAQISWSENTDSEVTLCTTPLLTSSLGFSNLHLKLKRAQRP
jgi:hypothetical protein